MRLFLPVLACLPTVFHASGTPGEFPQRSTFALSQLELCTLRGMATGDAAREMVTRCRAETLARLVAPPTPVETIHYEGLLNTAPARLATVEKLRSMDNVAAILQVWQVTGDKQAERHLRGQLLAWARTYAPTGNDVNENKLAPLLVTALTFRDGWTKEERSQIEHWLARMGERQFAGLATGNKRGNRYAKRLRLLALLAEATGRSEWRDAAQEGFRAFVTDTLRPDGTSYDLEHRDSLTYHVSALVSALELLHALGSEGSALYAWHDEAGSSLAKTVRHVVPYATGEKTREEWRSSKVELDHARAAAGIESYRPGRLYDGREAVPLLEMAARYDAEVAHALDGIRLKVARSAGMGSLINDAVRQATAMRVTSLPRQAAWPPEPRDE